MRIAMDFFTLSGGDFIVMKSLEFYGLPETSMEFPGILSCCLQNYRNGVYGIMEVYGIP